LLVCSNPSLAHWLEARAQQEPVELQPHLTIQDVSALCAWVLALGGSLTQAPAEEEKPSQLATLLKKAIQAHQRRGHRMPFDAILVDEAQDLDRPLWEPLQQLLRDRGAGLFYIFYDEAQREAEGGWSVPLEGDKVILPLVVNLRNTQAIFAVMMRFYRGPDAPICRGPAGRAPLYLDPATLPLVAPSEAMASSELQDGREAEEDGQPSAEAPTDGAQPAPVTDAEARALRLALDHLVDAEGILPEDILIITCRSQKLSRWYTAENRQIGRHRLIQRPEGGRPGRVALSTVRSAKGLERKVVILTELDGLDGAGKRDTLLYVALSRAMHYLVVLGPEKALQPRKPSVLALIRGVR
jgi:hypothetical protein